jgi:multicomponent Na+:H+ antiporter subunit E
MSRNIARRATGLLLLWLVLIGTDPVQILVGAIVAAAATAVSFRLRPASPLRVRAFAMTGIALRLAGQAVVAGIDVAWRALAPAPAVQPGFVSHRLRLPPGPARDAFCALMSLLPGTVPAGLGARDELLVHCLDVDVPVEAQLAADEDRFLAALAEPSDG